MTLTIGICDDSPEQIKLVKGYLHRFRGELGFTVIASEKPEEFLLRIKKNKPDLVFLDIEMGDWNGIELAEIIRRTAEDTVIVYITAYEKYAFAAFQVRAFHYLLKPLSEEKFKRTFQEALGLLKKNAGQSTVRKSFSFQRKGEIVSLDYNDILFFEKIGHKIKVHSSDRDFDFYGNFIKLLEMVDPDCFVQCHQGYIVNTEKIRGYRDKTLFLQGNLGIPVGRTYRGKIKELLADLLFVGADK